MKFYAEDELTIAVCENYINEATQVLSEQGWRDISLVSFPARCGRPAIAEEEIAIFSNRTGDMVVVGGQCLSDLSNVEYINSVAEKNCFSLFCGKPFVRQLLIEGACLISPGWLRQWKAGGGTCEPCQGQCGDAGTVPRKKVVLLDTLTNNQTKDYFEEYLTISGSNGECIDIGCDHFSLQLYRVVTEWRMQLEQKRLKQARVKSSEATILLNLLAQLEPAISFKKAAEQLVDLFRMFMEPEKVGVEIISNAVIEFRFAEDPSPILLTAFSKAGVYRSASINGFYLLVPIDNAKSAVIRVAGLYPEVKTNDYVSSAIFLKGLIRLILYNGILYNDLHAEIVHKAQIEKYLEKSENHFRLLYENAPLPYHSLDGHGKILEVNNAWLKTFGLRKDRVVGELFEKYLADDSIEVYRKFLERVHRECESWSTELGVIKDDSSLIRIQLDATTSTDSDGNIHQIHCIFVDISEKKRIEELILQSEKLSTIAGLAAGVAHEINTPLSGILQSAQLIEMFLDPQNDQSREIATECGVDLEKVREYSKKQDLDYFISGIRKSAINASEIIKNLLEFSRPSKGEWASVRLSHLIDQVVQLVVSDYDLKKKYNVMNVVFETDFDPNLPFVHCVTVEIEQVFFNIIKNAVHAIGESRVDNSRVTIRTRLKKHTACIEIEDNGPGIKKEMMKHIFDPFFTTKDPGEGTGLGLSIAHAIVVGKHSGLLRIDPDVTRGARFIIELPIDASQRTAG